MAPIIPDRWIPYKAFGKVIEGTRIICFKVPLRRECQVNNPKIQEIWDIKTLLKKIPKLGAVIDLTNTNRYYDPQELKSAGVLHKKILMPGRIIPPEDKVTEFMDVVSEFLEKDDGSLVGVHCTHGLNRTGYMVCRYLRDRMLIPAAVAVDKFEKARGYKIERQNFIADLLGKTPPEPDLDTPIPKDFKDSLHKRGSEVKIHEYYRKRKCYEYTSPVAVHEEEVDGRIMRYGNRKYKRNDNNKYYNKNRRDSTSSTDSYDFKYDY